MDKIRLEGLAVAARIGVYDWEKQKNTDLVMDLCLWADLSAAAASDDVAQTIDYAAVSALVQKVVLQRHYELIESLNQAIIDALFADFAKVQQVRVKTVKSDILPEVRQVSVEFTRQRGQ